MPTVIARNASEYGIGNAKDRIEILIKTIPVDTPKPSRIARIAG